jgi:hypothetical protein
LTHIMTARRSSRSRSMISALPRESKSRTATGGGAAAAENLAVEPKFDTGSTSRLQGFGGAHSVALQPFLSGTGWTGIFASAPSAHFLPWDFNGLARTVGSICCALPSASSPTVRGAAPLKPLLGFDFSVGRTTRTMAQHHFLIRVELGFR